MLGGVLRWIRCRLHLCSLVPGYDDSGIYWQCGKCGKVNR